MAAGATLGVSAINYTASGSALLAFLQAYWIVFVLIGALFMVRATLTGSTRPAALLAREICLAISFYFGYYLVRGMVKDQASEAQQRAHAVIAFERRVGLLQEGRFQQWAVDSQLLVRFFNWVYVWWFWWPIVFGLCWLFLCHREHYATYRNAMLLSGAIALVIFAIFPVAPPRFVDGFGVIDTVTQRSMSSRVLLPQTLANKYAAVPSLHAGWTLLIGLAFVRHARHLALRAFGVALPVIMFASIIATGNHFVIDGLVGYVVVLTGLALSTQLRPQHKSQPVLAPVPITTTDSSGRYLRPRA